MPFILTDIRMHGIQKTKDTERERDINTYSTYKQTNKKLTSKIAFATDAAAAAAILFNQ